MTGRRALGAVIGLALWGCAFTAHAYAVVRLLLPAAQLDGATLGAFIGLHFAGAVAAAEAVRARYADDLSAARQAWSLALIIAVALPLFGLAVLLPWVLRPPREADARASAPMSPMEYRAQQAEAKRAAEADKGTAGAEVETIADALKDADPSRRLGAVDALRGLENKEAVQLLSGSLDNTIFEVRYTAAEALAGINKKLSRRISAAADALEDDPTPENQLALADVYFEYATLEMEEASIQQHLYRSAVSGYDAYLAAREDPAAALRAARCVEATGAGERALKLYRRVIKDEPRNFEAHLGVARLQYAEGHFDQLRDTCRQLLELRAPSELDEGTAAVLGLWAEGPNAPRWMIRPMAKPPPVADVCLVLEGTYPFVTGGVSSWVHALIKGLPELTFSLFHVSASRNLEQERAYELPDNVVSFLECFVHDPIVHADACPKWRPGRANSAWKAIADFHENPLDAKYGPFAEIMSAYAKPKQRVVNTKDLLLSRRAWKYLLDAYQKSNPGGSFIDFFWTFRAVHMPIFQIINAETPPARVYHLVSTGYAGLAGITAKIRTGRPLLLTEHGIYVKERKIEINRADWIYTEPEKVVTVKTTPGVLKEIWVDNFLVLGKLTYEYADASFTLYGGNQELQIEFGADPARLGIIPNGVKMDVFAPLRDVPRPNDGKRRIGFVGRVVPIKDVKSFIKACKIASDRLDDVEVLILGPIDEDPGYYQECAALVALLGLEDIVTFYGRVDVRKYYPMLDVFVLTSLSEGQPLTILEASCSGVPSIATNVGGCSEMLLGRTDEDRALGPSGVITNIGQPGETGAALVEVLSDEALRQRLIASGYRRIDAYYRQDQVIATYRDLYRKWMAAPTGEGGPVRAGR